MKNFILSENQNFFFGDCNNCEAKCCNGKHGTLYSQIILEEFEKIYENFPILFIFGELNFIKPVVLLTNGKDFCPYLDNFKCTIYDKRPTVCRTYPLSPNIDDKIYIDVFCPEVGKNNIKIISKNSIHKNFDNEIFYDYQNKYINIHLNFENLKQNDFELLKSINNIDFYIYKGTSNSKYLKMHKDSIKNLNKFNI